MNQLYTEKKIFTNLLTDESLLDRESGKRFLWLLDNRFCSLSPERYGNYEPVRKIHDPNKADTTLSSWTEPFIWTRTKPRTEGSVGLAYAPGWSLRCAHISADILAGEAVIDDLISFVTTISVEFIVKFAFINFLTSNEISQHPAPNTVSGLSKGNWLQGVYPAMLVKYIPNVYWGTVFGAVYVDHFGRDVVMSSPAPIVKELDGGAIYIQLSESPFDLDTNYAQVDAVRNAVKDHLGRSSFYDPEAPEDYMYSVPLVFQKRL